MFSSDAHHQHKIEEAMRGVARRPKALQRNFPQRTLNIAVGDPLDGFTVKLRVRSMRAKLARPAKFERQVAGSNDSNALLAGPGFKKTAQGAPQLDISPGLRQRWGEDIGVDGDDGQVRLRARRDDGAGNTVVDAQFIAESQIKTGI